MILLIDNYDSFSYNLYQLIGSIDPDIRAVRNDEISVDEIRRLMPGAIILSPGPGRPADAGICEDVVREFAGKIPMLGVCLGHQAICEAMGGKIVYATKLMHGKSSVVKIDMSSPIFASLPEEITVGRYHSLAVEAKSLPKCLKEIAEADDGDVMAVSYVTKDGEAPVYGLQFHPESILTPKGNIILKNFLSEASRWDRA